MSKILKFGSPLITLNIKWNGKLSIVTWHTRNP